MPLDYGTSQPTEWHTKTEQEVSIQLDVDLQSGLASSSVKDRLEAYGLNEIQEAVRKTFWRMVLGQFADFMIMVLIVAAVVSGVLAQIEDALAILAIVILNVIIGAIQEYRAEQAVAALKKMSMPEVRVLRERQLCSVPVQNLVPV